jgi:plastocyanin
VLLAAALLLAGCAKQNAREAAVAGPDGTQSLEVDVVNDAFRPWSVEAELGLPLVIRLRNKGVTAHTFTVWDVPVDVVLQPGERGTVTIRPPASSARWRFLCRFHDAGGMHGGVSFGRPPLGPLAPRSTPGGRTARSRSCRDPATNSDRRRLGGRSGGTHQLTPAAYRGGSL